MIKNKKEFIEKVESFDETLQIDVYHKLKILTQNYTQNNNGVFFDLSEIDISKLQKIYDSINICVPKLNEEKIEKEEEVLKQKIINLKPPINDVNNFCEELESDKLKLNRKNIHGKYSVAKKKYNKQNNSDVKKIEDDIHLNELCKEKYII
jgi:hypothetical protein